MRTIQKFHENPFVDLKVIRGETGTHSHNIISLIVLRQEKRPGNVILAFKALLAMHINPSIFFIYDDKKLL
jgi:hypothetical protein